MNYMKTYAARPTDIKREWFILDAKNEIIGRIATRIARVLQGKHKTLYTPHVDMGDAVVVINAAQVLSTGKKEKTKVYHHHTGFPGGIKSITLEKLRLKSPEKIIEAAVKRMLPKGPLGRAMFKKLKVYGDDKHPHQAQQLRDFPL